MLITNDKSHSGVNKKNSQSKYLIDGSSDETRPNMVYSYSNPSKVRITKNVLAFFKEQALRVHKRCSVFVFVEEQNHSQLIVNIQFSLKITPKGLKWASKYFYL